MTCRRSRGRAGVLNRLTARPGHAGRQGATKRRSRDQASGRHRQISLPVDRHPLVDRAVEKVPANDQAAGKQQPGRGPVACRAHRAPLFRMRKCPGSAHRGVARRIRSSRGIDTRATNVFYSSGCELLSHRAPALCSRGSSSTRRAGVQELNRHENRPGACTSFIISNAFSGAQDARIPSAGDLRTH